MLDKPAFGWVNVTINNDFIGSASYLDWVPGLILEPCIRYLQTASNKDDFIGGGLGFNVEFDAEGWNFGIVQIGNYFYTYNTKNKNEPYINILKEVGYGKEYIIQLTKEVISDIEKDFEDWVMWDSFTEEDKEFNQKELTDLLDKAKSVISAQ